MHVAQNGPGFGNDMHKNQRFPIWRTIGAEIRATGDESQPAATVAAGSRAMIGVAGQDRRHPVELLPQHHPHQLMRPGQRTERQHQIGLVTQ